MKSVVRNKNVGEASLPRSHPSRRRGRSHIQLPFVAVTFAMTVDGKVTTKNYASVDFTSREDKATLYLSQARGVDLRWALQELRYDFKVKYVACEGGPALFRSLLEQGLVDQLNLTIAPFLFGGKNAPTLTGVSLDFLPRSIR